MMGRKAAARELWKSFLGIRVKDSIASSAPHPLKKEQVLSGTDKKGIRTSRGHSWGPFFSKKTKTQIKENPRKRKQTSK